MTIWAHNRVVAKGDDDQLAGFLMLHLWSRRSGGICFDFGTVIPMPPVVLLTDSREDGRLGLVALDVTLPASGASRPKSLDEVLDERWARKARITTRDRLLAHLERYRPGTLEAAQRLVACHRQTGCVDWHDWSVKHWGTERNARATRFDGIDRKRLTIDFRTAWSMPEPVLRALGLRHPQLRFEIAATDPVRHWAITGRVAGEVAKFEAADVEEFMSGSTAMCSTRPRERLLDSAAQAAPPLELRRHVRETGAWRNVHCPSRRRG